LPSRSEQRREMPKIVLLLAGAEGGQTSGFESKVLTITLSKGRSRPLLRCWLSGFENQGRSGPFTPSIQ
jgi:molybdopterin/thiamine biosynthesis adenylyltransferase